MSAAPSGLRPFFSFYGSKWRTASRYPAPSGRVIEPFAGSAGYSTWFNPAEVLLIDLDPIIVGVWDFLISSTPEEILALPDVPDAGVDTLAVPQEAKWLMGFWLNRGNASPGKRPSSWMRGGLRPRSFWGPEARRRIAEQVPAIRHWRVQEGNYNSAPDVEATWFVDPPYVAMGKHYRVSDVDFPALGAWSRARQGRVVVCEQVGADWLPFTSMPAAKSTLGRSAEAVWVSP